MKMARRLSWQISADLGQARDIQNGSKMTEFSAKMAPRFPRSGLFGNLEADWEASWAFWVVLGAIFAGMAEV